MPTKKNWNKLAVDSALLVATAPTRPAEEGRNQGPMAGHNPQ